jgi:hypothetical protein
MFVILIGSVARRDFTNESDIDICRIDCDILVNRNLEWPIGPINYIDYTIDQFRHLYDLGSLFIYHLLYEGELIEGDICEWNCYKSEFIFKDTYSEELYQIRMLCKATLDIDVFGNKFLSLYSNLFTLIKNYSIFYLAKNHIFIFNKKEAILKVFGDFHYDLLTSAYNYFERGLINDKLDYNSEIIARKIVNFYYIKMGEFENDKFSYGTATI